MRLSKVDSDFFFTVYYPLLYFSYSGFEEVSIEEFIHGSLKRHIIARDTIYKNRVLVDDYISAFTARSQTAFEPDRLALLHSIKNARFTDFIAVEKDSQLFLIDYRKQNDIYRISGLSQDAVDVFNGFPCIVKTAIFNFKGNVISDGINHIVKSSYPSNAAKLIMRDFERDIATNLKMAV